MKFKQVFETRTLPYSQSKITKIVYEQLKNGTIINCPALGTYSGQKGISFSTRISDDGLPPYYWVTNDERRKLLKSIETIPLMFQGWCLAISGVITSGLNVEDLLKEIAEGRLTSTTKVWKSGMGPWPMASETDLALLLN